MNYAVIKKFDIANGPGVRVSLFVSGCRHRCKNCFNSEAWDFNYGKPFTNETAEDIIKLLSPLHIEGFSLLGGEPFEPENQEELSLLLEKIKQSLPTKSVWCYTGFCFEEIFEGKVGNPKIARKMLENTDVLVDGKYVEELKNPELIFRGSQNQRIIDVRKSIKAQKVIWQEGIWQRKMGSGNIYE